MTNNTVKFHGNPHSAFGDKAWTRLHYGRKDGQCDYYNYGGIQNKYALHNRQHVLMLLLMIKG